MRKIDMIEPINPPFLQTAVIASTGTLDLFFDASDFNTKIESFKNREVKAKKIFTIKEVEKTTAFNFISKFHYLKEAKFFAKYCYGLFVNDKLVGCSTF